MNITIPPVPAGVEDPNDLAYGLASAYPPVRWDDPVLHDTLAWLLEEATKAKVFLQYDWSTSTITDLMTNRSTRQPVVIGFVNQFGVSERIEAHRIVNMAHVVVEILEQTFGFGQPGVTNTYPGLIVRHPVKGNPVGAPWPEQDAKWGRPSGTMYHPSESDSGFFLYGNPRDNQFGRLTKEQRALIEAGKAQQGFTSEDSKRYAKVRVIVGGSAFSAVMGDAWELLP